MINHKCIKCSAPYQDDDPDPYYCESCRNMNKKIAAEIDRKLKNTPSTRAQKSVLQVYEELPKKRGFVTATDLHNMGLL